MKRIHNLFFTVTLLTCPILLQSMQKLPKLTPLQSQILREQRGLALFGAIERGEQEVIDILTREPQRVNINWRTHISQVVLPHNAVHTVAGRTPLMCAVLRENLPAVQKLVRCGADVAIEDQQKKNALTYAVELDNVAIANALIHEGERHADPNCLDSLLVVAAQNQNRAMFVLLLKAGADPRGSQFGTGKTAQDVLKANGDRILSDVLDQALLKARIKSSEKNIEALANPKPRLQKVPKQFQHALQTCLNLKNPAKIAQAFFTMALADREFLTAMQNPKNLKEFFKALPGSKANRLALAEFFTDEGKFPFTFDSSVNVQQIKQTFKGVFSDSSMQVWLKKTKDHLEPATELVNAVTENDFSKVQQLLTNRYLDLGVEYGRKALVTALHKKNKEIVFLLLQAGIDPDLAFSGPGFSPWEQEAMQIFAACDPQMIYLLLRYGANPSYILPFAISVENKEITKLLMNAGASDLGTGQTPLMQAMIAKDARKAAFLLEMGADRNAVNPRDGRTALDYVLNDIHKRQKRE